MTQVLHSAVVGTDHRGLAVLSSAECMRRVARSHVGRLGFVHEGDVHILPINHAVLGDTVVFRSSWGAKLMTLTEGAAVCFEVDGFDPVTRTGWSVLIKGVIDWVENEHLGERSRMQPSASWLPDQLGSRWVRIRPEEISGRQIDATDPL